MNLKDAGAYFGYTEQAFRNKICRGELLFGTHFLKDGSKILIIVDAFKEFLYKRSGIAYGADTS